MSELSPMRALIGFMRALIDNARELGIRLEIQQRR